MGRGIDCGGQGESGGNVPPRGTLLRRILFRMHSSVSLGPGASVFALCPTGTILVFDFQIITFSAGELEVTFGRAFL